MGLTLTEIDKGVFGDKRYWIGDIAWDTSYPTGGEELLPQSLGMSAVDHVQSEPLVGGLTTSYDRVNHKLKALYYDYNNAADGGAIEVPDTTNIGTSTNRIMAIGN